jgi:ParB-like chromosome segregation protein Spo0J
LKLTISNIIVGERRREDMGDIQGLAESILKFGLLHPVVVDDQDRLVAGCRRLEACKMLEWEEIPVTLLGELSDKELREIELEENLRRKDLTELEKSKNMVELAEIKEKQLKEDEFQSDTDQKSKGRGRPQKEASVSKIAEAIGVPKTTLIDARQHVEAVKEYPELATFPKTHAIEIARQLKDLPPSARQEKREEIRQIEETGRRKLDQVDETYRIKKEYSNAIYGAATLTVDDDHLEAWLSNMLPADMQRQWELVEEASQKLEILHVHLKKIFGGPRLVKLGGKV